LQAALAVRREQHNTGHLYQAIAWLTPAEHITEHLEA